MNVKRLTTVLVVIVFILGLGILLYPTFSDLLNQFRQDSLIDEYIKTTEDVSSEDLSEQIKEARGTTQLSTRRFTTRFRAKTRKRTMFTGRFSTLTATGLWAIWKFRK